MPIVDENIAAQELSSADRAALAADDSAVTAATETPVVSQPESPDSLDTPVAGEQETETDTQTDNQSTPESNSPEADSVEVPESETEEQSQARKSRTARRFEEILTEKRSLSEKNALLEGKLRQFIGNQTVGGQAQVNPADNSAYWTEQYQRARQEGDEAKALDAWSKRENAQRREWKHEAIQEFQAKQEQTKVVEHYSRELAELNDVAPFIIEKDGRMDVDVQSPVVRLAMHEAQQRGVTLNSVFSPEFIYYANKAALILARSGSLETRIEAEKTKVKLSDIQRKSGLEAPSRTATSTATPQQARLRKLEAAAANGDRNAARELMTQAVGRELYRG